MRAKTCIVTPAGRRVCGTRVAAPSGAPARKPAGPAPRSFAEEKRDAIVRMAMEVASLAGHIRSDYAEALAGGDVERIAMVGAAMVAAKDGDDLTLYRSLFR